MASSYVERLSLPNTEGGRDFAPWLMHGDFSLLFLKDTSSKARLCSDLAYNYNSQSSCVCVPVGKMAPSVCGTTP